MDGMNKRRGSLINVIIILGAITLGIFFSEGLLRLSGYLGRKYWIPRIPFSLWDSNPKLSYTLKPNYRGSPVFFVFRQRKYGFPAVQYSINSEGFRGKDWLPLDEDAYRIVVLGDSVSFGLGIKDSEVFAYRLQEYMNELGRGRRIEKHFRVYNMSVPGYNIEQEYYMFLRWAPVVRPQMIIHCYSYNDDAAPMRYALGTIIWDFEQKTDSHLLFLFNLFRSAVLSLSSEEPKPLGKERAREYVYQLKKKTEEINARYVGVQAVSVQSIEDKTADNRQDNNIDYVRGWFKQIGAEYIDIMTPLKNDTTRNLALRPDDDHYNAYAHDIIAHTLANELFNRFSFTPGTASYKRERF
jgi:hypothetical protein